MSDFKVFVDGVERIVLGVNGDTSCESLLVALANATGKLGKLALVEKWRGLERSLPRDGKPFEYLQKWGKLGKEVAFILKDDSSPEESDYSSCSDDHHGQVNDLFENSLETVTFEQERKYDHLTRRLARINLELECAEENEEDYLYFTEEEIMQNHAKKLSQVLDLQSRDLSVFEAWEGELNKQKQQCEKLTGEIDSQRQKLRLLEVHVSDLEEVEQKLFSSLQSAKLDNKNLDNDMIDLADLEQEMTITQEELSKQRMLGERQVKEREKISRSFVELDSLIQRKNGELDSLGKDVSSSISYYDLDEELKLADTINDTSTEDSDDSEEVGLREATKAACTPLVSVLSSNGTKLPFATRERQQQTPGERAQSAAWRDLQVDRGVFV